MRIIRTAREMGIATVAVYSDADRDALHVQLADEAYRVGPAPPSQSYLDADTLIEAAHTLDSLNKGYGDNSKFRGDMDRSMVTLNDTMRSLRVLADMLARHPEALVQGRTDSGKE